MNSEQVAKDKLKGYCNNLINRSVCPRVINMRCKRNNEFGPQFNLTIERHSLLPIFPFSLHSLFLPSFLHSFLTTPPPPFFLYMLFSACYVLGCGSEEESGSKVMPEGLAWQSSRAINYDREHFRKGAVLQQGIK